MTKFINRTVDIVFFALLAMITCVMAVTVAETVLSGVVACAVGAVILAGMLFVVIRGRQRFATFGRKIKERLEPIPAWKLALFLGLFSTVTKIFFVFLFDNNADLHDDMAMYRSFAEQYADKGMITEHTDYAMRHYYTAFYGLVLSPLARLFGADTKVFTVALSVLHSVCMVLLFDMLKQYAGKAIAFTVLIIYCILPMGALQTTLLLHENGLFFFHILAFWLFWKAFRKDIHWAVQLGYVLAAAVVLSVGSNVNAAGKILFISFGIYAVAKIFETKWSGKKLAQLLSILLILALCFICAGECMTGLKKATVVRENGTYKDGYSLPYGWALYVGWNYESHGGWSAEAQQTYYQYTKIEDREEALEYQRNLVQGRLQQYKDEPLRIPVHLFHKIKSLWGRQHLPFDLEMGNALSQFVFSGMGGNINRAIKLINCFAFMGLYLMLLLAQWTKMKERSKVVTPDLHFRMAVIGVTLALLPFEVMQKYVCHLHICLFAALALMLKYYFSGRECK